MLDKTQASVAQSTVANATHLACAIASRVLGVSIPNQLHGESVARNTINRIVVEKIRQTQLDQGTTNAA